MFTFYYLFIYYVYVCVPVGGKKRVDLEFQEAVNCLINVGAENRTQVLCKSSEHTHP